MNKAYILILAVVLSYSVLAVSVDQECQDNGFDFGYAKYDISESNWELGSIFSRNYVELEGDAQEMNWTSEMQIAGVLRKAATNTSIMDGGMEGTINGWEEQKNNGPVVHDISHLTFCGNTGTSSSSGGGSHGVPEFSTVTLAAAVVATALGIVIFRRN